MNTSSEIVLIDRDLTLAMQGESPFRLQRLLDLHRASYDKDAFVAAMAARLLLEHDRRRLAPGPTEASAS